MRIPIQRHQTQGFTLLEAIAVISIISILLGMGMWKLNSLRTQSATLGKQQIVDTLNRLEQLAVAENLTLTNTGAYNRIVELQTALAGRGHLASSFNPNTAANAATFSANLWSTTP